jgi:hypothetical protein
MRKAVRRNTRKYMTSSMKEREERETEMHTKKYKKSSTCMEERSAGSKRVRSCMRRMRRMRKRMSAPQAGRLLMTAQKGSK